MNSRFISVLALAACAEVPADLSGDAALLDAISGPAASEGGDFVLPVGDALAAPPTGAELRTSAAVPGMPYQAWSSGHGASATVRFARAASSGTTCPPVLGGACLDLRRPALLGQDRADALGVAEISLSVPNTAPTGLRFLAQAGAPAVLPGSATVSNVVEAYLEDGSACPPGTVDLIKNASFERAAAGEWTGGTFVTTGTDPYEGALSAETNGNQQLFAQIVPTPVTSLVSAQFHGWHEVGAIQYIGVTYSDGSTTGTVVTTGAGWSVRDYVTELSLDPAKAIVAIEAWGFAGGGGPLGEITRFDAFAFCATP